MACASRVGRRPRLAAAGWLGGELVEQLGVSIGERTSTRLFAPPLCPRLGPRRRCRACVPAMSKAGSESSRGPRRSWRSRLSSHHRSASAGACSRAAIDAPPEVGACRRRPETVAPGTARRCSTGRLRQGACSASSAPAASSPDRRSPTRAPAAAALVRCARAGSCAWARAPPWRRASVALPPGRTHARAAIPVRARQARQRLLLAPRSPSRSQRNRSARHLARSGRRRPSAPRRTTPPTLAASPPGLR
jgi:hypothetical protein